MEKSSEINEPKCCVRENMALTPSGENMAQSANHPTPLGVASFTLGYDEVAD
jgi:hypothetical protein